MYTGGTALLDALSEAGVSFIFANLGSDHPAIIEAIAEAKATGRTVPRLITCPNEMVALSAAHGYTQATGRAQAVLVHVECGTQNLGGAVHNVARCRIPVLIVAGSSPFTQLGEIKGSRNEFIHWLQDVRDQHGIVRGYMKFNAELRTPHNLKHMVHRALQIASSDPQGPAYLVAAREVLEEAIPQPEPSVVRQPVLPAPLPQSAVELLARAFNSAKRPLIVTSYLGRNPEAVEQLVRLCRLAGIGVLDSVSTYLNLPSDNLMYQGFQGNEPIQNPILGEADVVLIVDCDVPWIPLLNRPRADARVYHIDVDPLKEAMSLWFHPAEQSFRADSATALRQITDHMERTGIDESALTERRKHYAALHEKYSKSLLARERPAESAISAEYLTACVRDAIGADAVVLNEGITNSKVITEHIARTRPATFFTCGASSIGWNGGAAIGMKLANPEKTIVSLCGDGSYMFSIPSTVHWMARRYGTPFLQVVYNNGGWRAPRFSTLAVHPDGYASKAEDIGVTFDPSPDYSGIAAAAGGAFAQKVQRSEDLPGALSAALDAVRKEGRAAVLDVLLPHL